MIVNIDRYGWGITCPIDAMMLTREAAKGAMELDPDSAEPVSGSALNERSCTLHTRLLNGQILVAGGELFPLGRACVDCHAELYRPRLT